MPYIHAGQATAGGTDVTNAIMQRVTSARDMFRFSDGFLFHFCSFFPLTRAVPLFMCTMVFFFFALMPPELTNCRRAVFLLMDLEDLISMSAGKRKLNAFA